MPFHHHSLSIVFFNKIYTDFSDGRPSACCHPHLFLCPWSFSLFFPPASLWRGALSLLSSGQFTEAEQAQSPQPTAAPERQQGKCKTPRRRLRKAQCVSRMHGTPCTLNRPDGFNPSIHVEYRWKLVLESERTNQKRQKMDNAGNAEQSYTETYTKSC